MEHALIPRDFSLVTLPLAVSSGYANHSGVRPRTIIGSSPMISLVLDWQREGESSRFVRANYAIFRHGIPARTIRDRSGMVARNNTKQGLDANIQADSGY